MGQEGRNIMQVILRKDVDHLGYAGDVVDVKRGYWRNYLQPRGFAETATATRLSELAESMERRRAVEAANETEAKELAEMVARTTITIAAQSGPQGKLYGSVGAADIVKTLEATRKLRLDPKKISLDEPIKALGTFMVPVTIYQGVKAELTVTVVESDVPMEVVAEKVEGLDEEIAEGVERHPRADETDEDRAARAQAEADANASAPNGEAAAAPAESAEGDASSEEAAEASSESTDAS
jgi:large subunit ribosomal protein L9